MTAVFNLAREQNAVLLFDEADAIASRRSASVEHSFQREANLVVNVLLQELEAFSGVAIFATNVAASFDPAFERRISTHVLFEMPGVHEREQIWRLQLHPTLTPLADDVDFRALAEQYELSGGDIRNAVLKAALQAAGEPENDAFKKIHQRHLERGAASVLEGKRVMRQSSLRPEDRSTGDPLDLMRALEFRWRRSVLLATVAGLTALATAVAALIVALFR
jgi:SpoVK/Ycf46/Vps4 family AAA+-type ATPase